MTKLNDIFPGGFDATAVDPQESRDGFEPLPKGAYDVEITNAEVKDARSLKGTGLKLEYTVIDGEFAKRKVFQYINLKHESPQAEQIGQSQLSALCRAVDMPRLTDSDQLFQKLLRISVKIRPAANGYEASNDVTGYEAIGTAARPSTPAARPASNASATKPSVPWNKKAA